MKILCHNKLCSNICEHHFHIKSDLESRTMLSFKLAELKSSLIFPIFFYEWSLPDIDISPMHQRAPPSGQQ